MRKVELVGAFAAYHATARDLRRRGEVDAEHLRDRQRVVRKELAAQFVARKLVAIDERDGEAAFREERRQGGAGRPRADHRDVYGFHNRIPKRYGKRSTTSARAARTFSAMARASSVV